MKFECLCLLLAQAFHLKLSAAEKRVKTYGSVSGCGNRQVSKGVYWTGVARSKLECHTRCQNDNRCVSVNVCGNGESETVSCSLSYSRTTDCDRLEYREGCSFSTMKTGFEDRCGTELDGPPCEQFAVQSCKKIKECSDQDLPDGEYWIYPGILHGRRIKVYCHDLGSDAPAEYLTLLEENYSVSSDQKSTGSSACSTAKRLSSGYGTTNFRKIRILIETMEVSPIDFLFSNSTDNSISFGEAWDCAYYTPSLPQCPKLGRMKINTNGTGLVVDRTLQWKEAPQHSRIDTFNRSFDGRTITATCGGWCGGCAPDGPLTLQLDTVAPPASSAKHCANL